MSAFPPPDPVAQALNARFGPEFGAVFAGEGAFTLAPLLATLSALGDPHLALPPVIHIAGTNGKGSTAAFCRAILAAAGLTVHAFTQPHLLQTTERIALAGEPITQDGLLAMIDRVAMVAAPGLSHFEAQTACAFLAFAETRADFVILEVGVGGKDDATNVIPAPAVSVITRIGADHTALLGPTLPLIARAKAGVIKPQSPVITAPQDDPAIDRVFEAAAARARSPLLMGGVDWTVGPAEEGFFLDTESASYHLPQPALPGPHQLENAALAALACLALDNPGITEDAVARGLLAARNPGRLQRLRKGPLARRAEIENCALFVDGGHNALAAAALRTWANTEPPAPWALVIGMLADKDAKAFFHSLGHTMQIVVALEPKGPRPAMPSTALRRAARTEGLEAVAASSLSEAVSIAGRALARPGKVLITGSLALASEAVHSELLA